MSNLFDSNQTDSIRANYIFIDNNEELLKYSDDIRAINPVSFDVETQGLDYFKDEILLVQLSSDEISYVIDVRPGKADILLLKDYFEDESVLKIGHNLQFDYSMLKAQRDITTRNMYCSMIAEQVLTAGIEPQPIYKLEAVCRRRLGIQMDKSAVATFIGHPLDYPFTKKQLEYAARDTLILPEIWRQQMIEAKKLKLEEIIQLEMDCLGPVADVTLRGCHIDVDNWNLILEHSKDVEARIEKSILHVFGSVAPQTSLFDAPDININSQKQLVQYLNLLGIPLQDTKSDTLEEFSDMHNVIELLLEYRELEKIRSAYGNKLLRKKKTKTGRIHPGFQQARAATGRMSSCFPAGTLILTDSGYKPIEEINTKDKAATRWGFKEVQNQWMSGQDKLYTVEFKNGSNLVLTGNHPLLTAFGWKNTEDLNVNDAVFLTQTKNLVEKDYIDISVFNKENEQIENYKRVDFNPPKILNEDLAELVGYSIGDGHLRKGRVISDGSQRFDKLILAVSWDTPELVDYWKNRIHSLFGTYASSDSTTCHEVKLNSTKACMFLKHFGLELKSVDTRVPEVIKNSNYKVVAAFLRGLFEADGCISDESISFKSTSSNLIDDIKLLFEQFGILATKALSNDKSGFVGKHRYTLNITTNSSKQKFKDFIGFISKKKKDRLNQCDFVNNDKSPKGLIHLGIFRNELRNKLYSLGVHRINGLGWIRECFRGNKNKYSIRQVEILTSYLSSLKIKDDFFKPFFEALETNLYECKIKSINVSEEKHDVYDLTIVDVHEFQVKNFIVKNSGPNFQQVHKPKSFYRKIYELVPADSFWEEACNLLKEYQEAGGTLPIVPRDAEEKDGITYKDKYYFLGKVHSSEYFDYPNLDIYVSNSGRLFKYIPDFRDCFTAPKGYKIISVDYSQQELRILASLSKDPKMMKAYKDGEDIHTQTAVEVFGSSDSEYRNIAKAVNFGNVFGQTSWGLSRLLSRPEKECQKILTDFRNKYPARTKWTDTTSLKSFEDSLARTVLGRIRWLRMTIDPNKFPEQAEWKRRSIERRGPNHCIQGCAADITKKAIIYVTREFRKRNLDAHIVIIVHDELVIEAREDHAEEAARITSEFMIKAFNDIIPDIPMLCDAKVSDHWAK